jgi:LemA protein
MIIWVLVGIVVLILVWVALAFNGLVSLRNRADNGWSEIDVQLRRRYDLIPNLVQTVQGYAAHERELFEDVAKLRTNAMGAKSVDERAAADQAVSAGIGKLMAVAENYPDLKASQNFLALQEELTGTESKIAYARQFYNDQVMKLNTKIQRFPTNLLAGPLGFTAKPFFQAEDAARGPVQARF